MLFLLSMMIGCSIDFLLDVLDHGTNFFELLTNLIVEHVVVVHDLTISFGVSVVAHQENGASERSFDGQNQSKDIESFVVETPVWKEVIPRDPDGDENHLAENEGPRTKRSGDGINNSMIESFLCNFYLAWASLLLQRIVNAYNQLRSLYQNQKRKESCLAFSA